MRNRQLLVLLVALTGVFSLQTAAGQSVRLALSHGTGTAAGLALLDFPVTGGRGSLGISYRGAPGLSLHLRNTTTFGPLGNVIVDLDTAFFADGRGRATLAGRGTLGPAAVRLRLHAANTADLQPLRQEGSFAELPGTEGSLVWGVQAGATWRLSRELLLVAEPAWFTDPSGSALLLPVEIQLPGMIGSHDLRLRVAALLALNEPAALTENWSSAGAGLRVDRGRQAAWEVWLLLGGNSRIISPGLSFSVQEELAEGTLRTSFRLEPWRSDLPVLALQATWTRPVGRSTFEASFSAGLPGSHLLAGLAWSLPLAR